MANDNTKVVRVWENAHEALAKLCRLVAAEKGLNTVTYTDAASLAILEAVERRQLGAK